MAGKLKLQKRARLGRWTLVKFIKSGGNGDVWFVEADGEEGALKALHKPGSTDYARFQREVRTCQQISEATKVAILPVLDHHLPDDPNESDPPWFVMPRATLLMDALAGTTLPEKVDAVRAIADTLAGLLEWNGLNHRDVKPENMYLYEGRPVIGDFGLVKGPDDPNLTGDEKVLGPWNHLPNEILSGEPNPDWERVDVYSLSTSLWRIVLEKPVATRGQIRAHEADSIARFLPEEPRIDELARLIERGTARDPAARPRLREFATSLEEWLAGRARTVEAESQYEVLRSRYAAEETRRQAVLDWLVNEVRSQPYFDRLRYEVEDPDKPSEEVIGLTEGQVGAALGELIEIGYLEGDPGGQGFGMAAPRYYSRLFPTALSFLEAGTYDELLQEAAPVAEAFVDQIDGITLSAEDEFVELPNGIRRTPAEAYFQMRLLESIGYLNMTHLDEGGTGRTLMNVSMTISGKRWFVELGPR